MRAVFRAKKPYYQIARDEVMRIYPVYSEPGEYYSESGFRVTVNRGYIGNSVKVDLSRRGGSFVFSEGEKHNQLILTDPAEIAGMRAFIEAREYIEELSCDSE